jgi:hypothetical protein
MKQLKYIIHLFIAFLLLSCDDIIDFVDITNESVTVLAPTDGAALTDEVTFSWDTIKGATDYRLQIATPNFENTVSIALDSTVTVTTFTQALDSGTYQWRVRAQNANYQTGYNTQSFTVDLAPPVDISNEEVELLSPANNLIFSTTDTINFSWDIVADADNYVIQIASPSFANSTELLLNETVSSPKSSVSNLTARMYEWRVKATNADFETEYTTQSFTVEE